MFLFLLYGTGSRLSVVYVCVLSRDLSSELTCCFANNATVSRVHLTSLLLNYVTLTASLMRCNHTHQETNPVDRVCWTYLKSLQLWSSLSALSPLQSSVPTGRNVAEMHSPSLELLIHPRTCHDQFAVFNLQALSANLILDSRSSKFCPLDLLKLFIPFLILKHNQVYVL